MSLRWCCLTTLSISHWGFCLLSCSIKWTTFQYIHLVLIVSFLIPGHHIWYCTLEVNCQASSENAYVLAGHDIKWIPRPWYQFHIDVISALNRATTYSLVGSLNKIWKCI